VTPTLQGKKEASESDMTFVQTGRSEGLSMKLFIETIFQRCYANDKWKESRTENFKTSSI